MRIFKDENNTEEIAKEMIRIMAQRDIFAGESPKGYPAVDVEGRTFHFKFVYGFIFFPFSWNKSRCLSYTEKLLEQIHKIEKTLEPNYMNSVVCSRRDPITSSYTEAHSEGIAFNPTYFEDFTKYRMVFKWGHEKDLHKFSGARMTWFLTNIDRFSFEIANSHREFHLTENLASIFLDFYGTTNLPNGCFVNQLSFSHFKLHAPHKLGFICKSKKPLMIQLNRIIRHIFYVGYPYTLSTEVPYPVIDRFEIIEGEIKLPNDLNIYVEEPICDSCNQKIYDQGYVAIPKKGLIMQCIQCALDSGTPFCSFLCSVCIRIQEKSKCLCKGKDIYEISVKRTIADAIDESDYPEEVKKIYRKIASGKYKFSTIDYKKVSCDILCVGKLIGVGAEFYKKIILDEDYLGSNRKYVQCEIIKMK